MQVSININIGNDAMQTWEDVADALRQPLNHSTGDVSEDDKFPIYDRNGNKVGTIMVAGWIG